MRKKSKPRQPPDPMKPTVGEVGLYLGGDPGTALDLYVTRMHCGRSSAEDHIRAHLTDLGFKELPVVHVPREN